MNVHLLLLLALAGPFCAFTHASPTKIPSDTVEELVPEVTEAPKVDLTVITGPPATEPVVASQEDVTEGITQTEVAQTEVAATEVVATEVVTEAAHPAVTVNTEEAVIETEAPAASPATPEPLITDSPVVETAAPTEPTEEEVHQTAAAKIETDNEVIVEDGPEEGFSSGQVVGIVIGALLAVIIVIAVVIAVVRRMGKYSSAKNKKTAKRESVMVSPLRKKSAKQQERPQFWKF